MEKYLNFACAVIGKFTLGWTNEQPGFSVLLKKVSGDGDYKAGTPGREGKSMLSILNNRGRCALMTRW